MKKITFLVLMLISSLVIAQPTSAPPTPNEAAVDVVSVFSDSYTSATTLTPTSFGQNNNTATVVNAAGNDVYEITVVDGDFLGFNLGNAIDLTEMENLHYDIWIEGSISVGAVFNTTVSYHANGHLSGQTIGYVDTNASIMGGQEGQWLSFDIPFSDFAPNLATGSKDIISQLVFTFTNLTSDKIYVDNFYFWRESVDPNADASLSDLLVDGATVDGFSPEVFSYNVELPDGTTDVPTVTATATQANATIDITDAASLPGSTTVEVTSPNGANMETYTINFSIGPPVPPVPAPTPPARDPADVVSIFSGAYTDVNNNGIQTFGALTLDNIFIDGDETIRATIGTAGSGFQYNLGIANGQDLKEFTHLHFDYYNVSGLSGGEVVNFILQTFTATGAFIENIIYTEAVITSSNWVSVDVTIDSFNLNNANLDNVGQVQLVFAGPLFGPVYLDNIYFHKNTTLSSDEFDLSGFNVYPNPTQNTWNIVSNGQNINKVVVFDALGKSVMTLTPKSDAVSIDSKNLSSGLYFARVEGKLGIKSIKLLKQ